MLIFDLTAGVILLITAGIFKVYEMVHNTKASLGPACRATPLHAFHAIPSDDSLWVLLRTLVGY